MYPGKFIVFEGAEGGGKTTQVKILASRMKEAGYTVLDTKEPTADGVFGALVRFIYQCESLHAELPQILRECIGGRDYLLAKEMMAEAQSSHLAEFENIARELQTGNHANLQKLLQLGMTFDRRDHRSRVEIPALAKGIHVISDRDFPSTPAYAAADDLDWRELFELQFAIVGKHFVMPDLIIFLDVPVALGLERTIKKQRGKKEYFDTKERLEKIQKAYYALFADPRLDGITRIKTISGEPPPEMIHELVWQEVAPLLRGTPLSEKIN